MSLIHLFVFANLLSLQVVSSFSPGSRSILRYIGSNNTDQKDETVLQKDNAVELNVTNFDSVLQNTPARYAIVEFFAHWCPACRNYKPQYEQVARLFNGAHAIHPGLILMTRVDCALKINTELCDKFSVSHYPMLFWGPPIKFTSGNWEPKQDKSEIQVIDDGRTAERLLNWINKRINSSYGLDDDHKLEKQHLLSNISDYQEISEAVYDIEEATAEAFNIIITLKTIKSSKTSDAFIRFLQLLVAHHPSRRCRKGSADILVNFDDLCPSGECSYETNHTENTLGNFHICGEDFPHGYYRFCRGSRNDTRGFSCGLWVLMHSLSVRIEDGESQFAFTAICDFIHHFFICEDCRQHFYDMCSSVKTPFKSAREFVMWLWSAHNKVNERLVKEEASLATGDPKFPKMKWPPKQLCPQCHLSGSPQSTEWDHDNVYKFLRKYYGESLVSQYKEKGVVGREGAATGGEEGMGIPSRHAVVVPVGAAVAIAVASCGFGGLACYWRAQQKNRKPRRSWNN